MRKNEAVAEVAGGIGFIMFVIVFLVGYAKVADPTQYSLAAQVPNWAVVIMIVSIVFCLLADWLVRPRDRKAFRREQDSKKIKNKNWRRNHYFGC